MNETSKNRNTRSVTRLTPNVPRIIAAIYQIISDANSRGQNPSQYDVVKTLFLADREHLNEWGRPITYDNYAAMKHGPVPSLAYDFLKANARAMREAKVTGFPWVSQLVPNCNGMRRFSTQGASHDVDQFLSESDLDALNTSLTMVLKLGFSQIRRLTHDDPAYKEAWQDNGDSRSYDMRLELLFEQPNPDRAILLSEQSAYV